MNGRRRTARSLPLRRVRRQRWLDQEPTWKEAGVATIEAAADRAARRPTGNWYVVGSSGAVRPGRAVPRRVAGRELVVWRAPAGDVHAGPGACPHLGAPLCDAPVDGHDLVCRWHGMRLGPAGSPAWPTNPCHDDGVLLWVRLDDLGGEEATKAPPAGHRPDLRTALTAVVSLAGRCEPRDVVANRLDPWHGAWFHPYSFGALTVLESPAATLPVTESADADRFLVRVDFRLGRQLAVPVTAAFTAPGPRTVVMEIVEGEGVGSVVETHATPVSGPGEPARTIVTEAVVAASARRGFAVARALAPLVRPAVRRGSARLWRDDLAYAERRHALRTRQGGAEA
ncbi:DUF5914 domain-containing protein [Kitasatospora sp. NPDC093679]|uniref:DUF5914 domain-containing protein n=1 Tax=Kitasatospora sp. NPDC093679 TaxID=3154983 RepID=UPI003428F97E